MELDMTLSKALILVCALVGLSACNSKTYTLDAALTVKAGKGLKYGDSDPVSIKGRQPKDFPIHGVDVSRYNKNIDWRRAKSAGIQFAFIKATEGKDDRDPSFRDHWKGAGKAGIARAGYHFYYFCAPAKAQARNFINAVSKRQSTMPPVLDVEWNPKSPTCKIRPPAHKVVRELRTWLKQVERHYGRKPIIYTTVDFHRDNLADGSLGDYPFWLRSVTAEPKFKYPNRKWLFWQYSGTGRAPGFDGDVDLNVFRGSKSAWNDWLQKNGN